MNDILKLQAWNYKLPVVSECLRSELFMIIIYNNQAKLVLDKFIDNYKFVTVNWIALSGLYTWQPDIFFLKEV